MCFGRETKSLKWGITSLCSLFLIRVRLCGVVSEHRFSICTPLQLQPFRWTKWKSRSRTPPYGRKVPLCVWRYGWRWLLRRYFFLICGYKLIHANSNQFICQTCSQFFPSSTTKSVAKITPIIVVLINLHQQSLSLPAKLIIRYFILSAFPTGKI